MRNIKGEERASNGRIVARAVATLAVAFWAARWGMDAAATALGLALLASHVAGALSRQAEALHRLADAAERSRT